MQYMMSLLYYGSHQLLICKIKINKIERSVDFNQYKTLIVKKLKIALSLPKKGKVEPMIEMFFRFDPKIIITQNYLQ